MSPAARLHEARRALVVGIGGGGDVVGALAFALAAGDAHGCDWVVGGLSWERRVVDPVPGPRRLSEIAGATAINEVAALARAGTTGPGGFRFCESAMAEFLDSEVVLVDPNGAPAQTAAGLDHAAAELGCDHVVLLDVGGDALAHGHEPGLASPLADAVMLAAATHMRTPVTGCVFGAGCDGELEPHEVIERVGEVAAAGGLHDDLPLSTAAIERALAATELVVTEASVMALRCARGETGTAEIRRGLRTVSLTADGGRMIRFDPHVAVATAAHCAAAVQHAESLLDAHAILTDGGVRTELELEREAAARGDLQYRAR